ncbi:MAG TPA: DUF3857 domain-containing protein [Candidatus Limnocylindrales bacterium]|nr:DUF3857 domain-containing protein [Candidatus Limnocylindrales bacterium]
MSRSGTILCLCLLALPLAAQSQSAPQAAPKSAPASKASSADFSREPQIIEKYDTTVRFENDGTGERTVSAQIKVQDDAAAQKLSEFSVGYIPAHDKVEIVSVSVHRADGSTATAPSSAFKETPAATDFPGYAAYKQISISAPAMRAGDTLEYKIVTHVTTPFAPREFWFQHTFLRKAVVFDERLELNLPAGRHFALKSPGLSVIAGKEERSTPAPDSGFTFSRSDENGRVILRWKHSNLTPPPSDDQQQAEPYIPPDVQLSTFASWTEVARWYAGLERDRTQPTPEIRAKVASLIEGRATNLEKTRAIYDYAAKNVRYVNISFDSADFQSRPAGEIFNTRYGDSNDICALLTAMLDAAGIRSEAAFVAVSRKLDSAVPSPEQFGHVVSVVPNSPNAIWMDATSDVAPFRFLAAPLRGKPALIVAQDGAARIASTPADPPFPSTQRVEITASVSPLGKLTGAVHYSLRGDTEFVLRTAFQRAQSSQRNQLAQTILNLDGLHGDVLSVKTSDPLDTAKPFELTVEFSQPAFFDWSSKTSRAAFPLLTIGMPDPPTAKGAPIELGSSLDVSTRLSLHFPPGFTVQTPVGVGVSRDYAEFKSSYHFEDGSLTADRSLNFEMRAVPAARIADYLAFTQAVESDENQPLSIENTASGAPTIPADATAAEIFEAGSAALEAGNTRSAIPLLQRVTELAPKHKQAWNDLGIAYMRLSNFEDAVAAFRKQLVANPSDEHANNYLGIALDRLNRPDDAAAAFRNQVALNPLDPVAHAALGTILLEQHRDSDAVPELEKAVILAPDNANLEVSLGRAYLNTSEKEKALSAFDKAIALAPTPDVFNDVAYDLADRGVELDRARHYAESAIAATETKLEAVTPAHIAASDLTRVSDLASYWDTLGWIDFHSGDLLAAERYLQSAWLLDQNPEVAAHLAQLYEKSGDKDRAIREYALALAAPHPFAEARARLMLLLGGNTQIDDLVRKAAPDLEKQRTLAVPARPAENLSADFVIIFSPEGKEGRTTRVDAIKFLNDSEALRAFIDRIRSLDYGSMFPAASRAKLIRRGTLVCSASSAACTIDLIPAEDALR